MTCSDSAFIRAVSPLREPLNTAVLVVQASHGDVDGLTQGAKQLIAASQHLRRSAIDHVPCQTALITARRQTLVAARDLSVAAHRLILLTNELRKGQNSSEGDFFSAFATGTSEFQTALASVRSAGAGPLVAATDGRAIFKDAGCGSCHTLAAAGSTGKIGPDFDRVKPSKNLIVKTLRASKLGTMVAYRGLLSNAQVNAVAVYIARHEGG